MVREAPGELSNEEPERKTLEESRTVQKVGPACAKALRQQHAGLILGTVRTAWLEQRTGEAVGTNSHRGPGHVRTVECC